MRDLLLDSTGKDLLLETDLQWVEGIDQVIQSAEIILNTPLGDFSLEPTFGLERVNLLGKIIIREYAARDIKEALVNNSKQIIGVKNIIFNQDKSTRNLRVDFNLELENNLTVLGGTTLNA